MVVVASPFRKLSKTRINLFLDIALALAFVVQMEEHFMGLRNHEVIGLFFGAALLIHLVLHWQWIVGVTRTFFRNLLHGSRLKYVLNLALLVDAVVMVVTGLLISRTLGLSFGGGHAWERVHILSAELSLLLIGLHVAVHWQWIAAHTRKYLCNVRLPLRKASAAHVSVESAAASSEV